MVFALLLWLTTASKPQKLPRQIYDIEIEPDDQWMAVSCSTDDVWIIRIADGKVLRTLHHRPGSHLVDIEISPDRTQMLCTNTSWEGDYTPVWSTKTWKEIAKIGIPMTQSFWDGPNGLEYAGGGRYAIGPTLFGHQLVAWNAQTGAVAYIARKNAHFGSFGIAVNANTTFVAVHEPQVGRIRFWEFEGSAKTKKWGSYVTGILNSDARMLRFSHDDQKLFVLTEGKGSTACTLNICEPKDGTTVIRQSDRINDFQPRDMSWSADDRVIYIAGLKGQIICFNPLMGNIRNDWIGHNGAAIRAVASFHSGPKFVTGAGNSVCVWSGVDGKLLKTVNLPP